MAGYFFGSTVDVEVRLDGEDGRKIVDIKPEKDKDKSVAAPVYFDGDSVGGQVRNLGFQPCTISEVLVN
jgi:vacuolar protein sorting-associated protein 26